jgi:hypothetical protein
MPRGVMTVAETQQEAERQVLRESPQLRILRSREIDLSGLPPLRAGPLPKHWVVVVAHEDSDVERTLPQHDDPEDHSERETRLLYLNMATDPDLLTTGVTEELTCPACSSLFRFELPPPRETRYPLNRQCPDCRAHLRKDRTSASWVEVEHARTPYPSCVFCPAPADSREHVVPAWISKRFGITELLSAEEAFIVGGSRLTQPISFANYRARVMCDGCNTHFKHLEDAVISLLVPMGRGLTLSLNRDSQGLLALWASKTALALMAARPDEDNRRLQAQGQLIRQGQVPPDTWVAYMFWHGGPIISTACGGAAARSLPGPEREIYGVILTFAGVGVYVTSFLDGLPSGAKIGGAPQPLRQCWPIQSPYLNWPPPTVDNRILPTLLSFAPLQTVRGR